MLTQDAVSMPHFLFFARHNNDIDHAVPIIWGLLRQGIAPQRIAYIAYEADSSIEPKQDLRLQFLAQKGVSLQVPYFTTPLCTFFRFLSVASLGKTIRRKARKILFRNFVNPLGGMKIALQAVEGAPSGSVVVMDHCLRESAQRIVKTARERKFSTISFPHGFQFHFGFTRQQTEDLLAPCSKEEYTQGYFDHVLVNDPWQKELISRTVNKRSSIHVMGLPRFSPEWMQELVQLYPVKNSDGERLKVLVILEKGELKIKGQSASWINIEKQFEAVLFLSQHPGVELIIKGNARGLSGRQSRLLRPYKQFVAEDSIPTTQLISWADVCVGCCSSVFMDAIVRNKPIILLEYATYLKMAFKQLGFCSNPDSYQQFTDMINMLVECRSENLYDENSLQRVIDYYVYGEKGRHSVVDAYANFLQSQVN